LKCNSSGQALAWHARGPRFNPITQKKRKEKKRKEKTRLIENVASSKMRLFDFPGMEIRSADQFFYKHLS
jgi:hypothetical protein